MSAKNDITGDLIKTKGHSPAYEDNYDRIFGKPKPKQADLFEGTEWDEARIDAIGQNGNTGEHYDNDGSN